MNAGIADKDADDARILLHAGMLCDTCARLGSSLKLCVPHRVDEIDDPAQTEMIHLKCWTGPFFRDARREAPMSAGRLTRCK